LVGGQLGVSLHDLRRPDFHSPDFLQLYLVVLIATVLEVQAELSVFQDAVLEVLVSGLGPRLEVIKHGHWEVREDLIKQHLFG